jgi:hypothetical protein
MQPIKQRVRATITVTMVAAVMAGTTLAHGAQQTAPESTTAPETTAAGTQAAPATTEASETSATKGSYTLEVSGTKGWTDTNIDLRAGEKLQITAEGTITYAKGNHFGPAGIQRSIADVIHQYAVPNGAHGELIGRLGSGDAAEAFEVGASATYTAPVAGRLFLGINRACEMRRGQREVSR